MKDLFEIAGGSVIGRHHRQSGRNNQDAFCILPGNDSIIAVVTDGCGSSPGSEVGAKLGAQLIANSLKRNLSLNISSTRYWDTVRLDVLRELYWLTRPNPSGANRFIEDYGLFTAIAAVIHEDRLVIAAIGDGLIVCNDNYIALGPFSDNQPPYIAYGLFQPMDQRFMWQMKVQEKTAAISHLLIATDGIGDYVAAANKIVPGQDREVGPLLNFWTEDRYFKNPDSVRRQLTLVNRDVSRPLWQESRMEVQNGHLTDDTTLVVIRKVGPERRGIT
ncbi:MAG: protein phosphatase 2C domain-containing protein [Candidatus Komeilibacteria bacterium]|nr:protein phosphatase 2C domain-containing protein [Candidatus Komeilibacteria bacterium]